MHQPPAHSPRAGHAGQSYRLAVVVTLVLALTCSLVRVNAAAAPGPVVSARSSMQNVDYLGADASRLDLDFQVLVPSFVPAPFGKPSVSAGGGVYSLYWMVEGGSPTFLYITGQVGGSLPAGSPYDLNNELFINARVQGFEAIHDVTPDYDTVWWIANGVLYSVESMNMTGSDTMSLANGLIPLAVPPATDEAPPKPTGTEPAPNQTEPNPTVETPDAVDPSPPGISPPLGSEPDPTTESESAPTAESRQTAEPEPTSPASAVAGTASTPAVDSTEQPDGSVSGETVPAGTPAPTTAAPVAGEVLTATPSAPATPNAVDAPEASPVATPGGMSSDGTGSPVIPSDGTGGPPPPITGSDGTGGTSDLSLAP